MEGLLTCRLREIVIVSESLVAEIPACPRFLPLVLPTAKERLGRSRSSQSTGKGSCGRIAARGLLIYIHQHAARSPSFPSLYLHAKLYLRFSKRATPTVTLTTPTTTRDKMFKLTTASLLAVLAASVAAQSIPQYQSVSGRVV
jgi:hypothetical protein